MWWGPGPVPHYGYHALGGAGRYGHREPAGGAHQVSLNAHPMEYIVLGVEGLEFAAAGSGDGRYSLFNFRRGPGRAAGAAAQHPARDRAKDRGVRATVCQNLLEILVVLLMRHTDFFTPLAPARRSSKECAAVKRYIDANFKESITPDQLAEMAHVNKYYLVHSFSKEYEISPINYLIERARSGKLLFIVRYRPLLSQISHMMGFSSPSYFSSKLSQDHGHEPHGIPQKKRAERASFNKK